MASSLLESYVESLPQMMAVVAVLCSAGALIARSVKVRQAQYLEVIQDLKDTTETLVRQRDELQARFIPEEPAATVPDPNDDELFLRLTQVDAENWRVDMVNADDTILMEGAKAVPYEYALLMLHKVLDYAEDNNFSEGEEAPLVEPNPT